MAALGPRVFGIPATEAPYVAVVRRGPSNWCHVGRWDPDAGTWEPGSWTHGVLYPQRCDVSPDGRWFSSFVLKARAGRDWAPGTTFEAISRLPWLTALAAWGTGSTWTRGLAFVPRGTATYPPGPPDVGDPTPLLARYDLEMRRPGSFAVERARGWTETPDSPPPSGDDPWEIRRAGLLTLAKARPAGSGDRLLVSGWYAAYRGGEPGRGPARYRLAASDGAERPLPGVQWADWTRDGRLLVATDAGELQVREDPRSAAAVWRVDLSPLTPVSGKPPADARTW